MSALPAPGATAALVPAASPAPAPRLVRSTAAHVIVAALAMGAWAAFANRQAGAPHLLAAAGVQAVLSGTLTAGLKRTLERLGAALPGLAAALLPPALTCAGVLVVLVTAHTLARTPDLWGTISVPYAVSSGYAWVYSFSLFRRRGRTARALGS